MDNIIVDLPPWSYARVIKGIHDGTYYTVATDEDGNIIGVFKGEYNDELITIKTDSEGRMLAIITDPEDIYGNVHQFGNAELAARLGYPGNIDRTGNVYMMDNFEASTLKWKDTSGGTGAGIALDTTYAQTGDTSLKLTPGSDVQKTANAIRYFDNPPSTRIGLEASVLLNDTSDRFYVGLDIYDGSFEHTAHLMIDPAGEDLKYLNLAGGYTTLAADVCNFIDATKWSRIKFSIDFSTYKYVKAFYNYVEYDISAIGYYKTADAGDPHMRIVMQNHDTTGASTPIWVDNVVLTYNEP